MPFTKDPSYEKHFKWTFAGSMKFQSNNFFGQYETKCFTSELFQLINQDPSTGIGVKMRMSPLVKEV